MRDACGQNVCIVQEAVSLVSKSECANLESAKWGRTREEREGEEGNGGDGDDLP